MTLPTFVSGKYISAIAIFANTVSVSICELPLEIVDFLFKIQK